MKQTNKKNMSSGVHAQVPMLARQAPSAEVLPSPQTKETTYLEQPNWFCESYINLLQEYPWCLNCLPSGPDLKDSAIFLHSQGYTQFLSKPQHRGTQSRLSESPTEDLLNSENLHSVLCVQNSSPVLRALQNIVSVHVNSFLACLH